MPVSERDVLLHLMLYATSAEYRAAKIPYISEPEAAISKRNSATSKANQRSSSVAQDESHFSPSSTPTSEMDQMRRSSAHSPDPVTSTPIADSPTEPIRPTWAHVTPLKTPARRRNQLIIQALDPRRWISGLSGIVTGKQAEEERDEDEVDELATPVTAKTR